jgi:hypothetical protein
MDTPTLIRVVASVFAAIVLAVIVFRRKQKAV